MSLSEIDELIALVRAKFGDLYIPYGTCPEEIGGTGFRIKSIPATFSIILINEQQYPFDIQIESFPPGDYIYNTVGDLNSIFPLIARFQQAQELWPVNA